MYYFSNVFERELYPVVNIHFADAEYLRVELAVNRIGPLPADSRYSFHHAYNRTRRCGVAVGGEACLNGAAENLLMYNPNDTGYTYYAIFKLPILTATPDTDPITHSITVTADENGTASASAEAAVKDTEITLTAAPKEGFRFKEWQVIKGGIEITDNKFVMPDEDVEVKAIFEAIPEVIPEEHSITIIPVGKGKTYSVPKTAVAGTEITLHAEPDSGWIFYGWEEVVEEGVDKVTIASDKFIMPDRDVVIKVIFVKESSIKVTTDGNGTASADKEKALNGEEITLTATPKEGYAFKEWQVIRGNVEIKDNKFVMPDEDVTVKAIFAEIKDAPNDDDMNVKRDIHFVLVKTDGNGLGVAYPPYSEAGTKVTVVAIAKPSYKFKEWKVVKGGVELENKSIATFEMPAENVILEAIFESDGTEGDKPTLPDIPKPDKPGATDVPDTGDTTNVFLWAAALVIGGGATIGTVVSKKKKREES